MILPLRRLCPAIFIIALCVGCSGNNDPTINTSVETLAPAEMARLQTQVMTFCGACHGPPQPDSFPRDAWYHEIELAYRLFHESGRQDLVVPPMADVVRWYRSQAPADLPLRQQAETPSPVSFRRESVATPGTVSGSSFSRGPGVSHFQKLPDQEDDRQASLLFCDMSRNGLFKLSTGQSTSAIDMLVAAQNPAHAEVSDLNANGQQDYLLCEMGSFLPEDHNRGRLLWLEETDIEHPSPHVLVENVGRVVDARPGDFDADGDLDVIVAVFGWRKTGALLFLEQTSQDNGVPQFQTRQLDDRHGAIHIPAVDLDADGDLDFIALFSQEHETVEAFLNRGDATFERQIIYLTGSPSYGSSGIELVDFDTDGDIDVLYTNGDTLDSSLLKPYHSVQWLENTGDFPFIRRHIGWLPGAYRAVSADIDSDGDLDVVASAWIPGKAEPPSPRKDGQYATLVWYERDSTDEFVGHALATAAENGFMTLTVDDINGDKRPDIIAGSFGDTANESTSWVEVFWNRNPQ